MQEEFSWDGKYFKMPPRNVIPKPYQKPHPPMWVAVSSPETAIQAAERGIGCLGVSIGTPGEFEKRVQDYHRIIKTCEPVGEFVNNQVNGVTFLHVAETDDEAQVWGTKLAYNFAYLAAHLIGISSVYPSRAYKTPGLLFSLRAPAQGERVGSGGGVIREGMGIGSPETVIKNLKMWEDIGVDRMVFILDAGGAVPQERILQSLRLFAEHVMPAFDKSSTARTSEREPDAALPMP